MSLETYWQLRQYRNDLGLQETFGTAPPSASTDIGPYKTGDLIWNTAPAAGQPLGWVCSSGGATGAASTWVPFFVGALETAYNTNTATGAATLTAANISGGKSMVVLAMTGTMTGNANLQLPTVAALVTALGAGAYAGRSYLLRIINESSANYTWTVTTNTGWGTLTGTYTIAQNTFRDFVVTLTSLTAATLPVAGVGTFS